MLLSNSTVPLEKPDDKIEPFPQADRVLDFTSRCFGSGSDRISPIIQVAYSPHLDRCVTKGHQVNAPSNHLSQFSCLLHAFTCPIFKSSSSSCCVYTSTLSVVVSYSFEPLYCSNPSVLLVTPPPLTILTFHLPNSDPMPFLHAHPYLLYKQEVSSSLVVLPS